MELRVLGTGSSGNCYALCDGDELLLLDAGLPAKKILRGIDHRVGNVAACLITHEHQDHCRGAADLNRLGVPMLGTTGTRETLPFLDDECVRQQRRVGGFDVMAVSVLHDCRDPCGWLVRNVRTGEKLLYATDTGGLLFRFPGVHYWLIECNYAETLLGDTPEAQRERLSRYHMSLERLERVLARNDLTACRQIVLCHMSRERGDARLMTERIAASTGKPVAMAAEGLRVRLEMEPF